MGIPWQSIRFVFLDRDGVINRKPPEGQYIAGWSSFELLPGAETGIVTLSRSGRTVIVVSNQRGVALGYYTSADVEALHAKFEAHLAARGGHIDAFYYCPHDRNQCTCRKPETGMLEQAFRDFPEACAANSLLIGDSLSDIQAAKRMGMISVFIEGDPATRKPGGEEAAALADFRAVSLVECVAELRQQPVVE